MIKVYISFKGNCAEALKFYESSLNGKLLGIMKYSELPSKSNEYIDEVSKDLILHSEMEIEGTKFIFNDYEDITIGDNFSILLELDNEEQVRNYYENLKEGGSINIDIGPTDFSKLYVNLKDKFGINWILMC